MRRVLLLMTSETYRAQAFLDAVGSLGVEAVVATDRTQVLEPYAPDHNLTLDFADPGAAAQTVAAFAERTPVDAVVAAEDEGVIAAAAIASRLGLRANPLEAVTVARDKYATREALRAAGLEVPRYRRHGLDADPEAVARETRYPSVIKPLTLSASRGVIRVDEPSALVAAWRRVSTIVRSVERGGQPAAREPGLLVEEYLPGIELALEGIVEDGRVRTLALFDKPDPLEGPYFEETIYQTPSRLAPEMQAEIERTVQRAVTGIGLRHGALHAEVRLHAGTVWVLEIAPRSIGGRCSRVLRFGSERISLEELLLRFELGLPGADVEREPAAAGVLMIPIPERGRLESIRGESAARAVPGIESLEITVPRGAKLVPLPEGHRYLGFVFARGNSPAAVERALRAAHAELVFTIRPETVEPEPSP